MSITLDPTLKTAQDGQSHHPIFEIISKPMVPDIPFVGQFLTDETNDEQYPNIITHSSKRLSIIYKFHESQFKYVYTDEDRTTFYFVTLNGPDLGMALLENTIESSICELPDGNLGMVFTSETNTTINLRWAKISVLGEIISYGLIASYLKSDVYNLLSPFVIRLQDNSYLLAYLKGFQMLPVSSGEYTGTTNGEYEVQITVDGTETTAKFRWRKDDGEWSSEITCTGGTPQLLDEGVYINFVAGDYYAGQSFKISVKASGYAKGYITILSNALDGDQIVIGSQTYTYKTVLVGGGNPNEVVIDILGMEITLENLRCAIMDDSFEGLGEGVRYGNGTVEHPQVTAERSDRTLTITAKEAGAAGNSITITTPGAGRFVSSTMSGGADSEVGTVRTRPATLIMKRTSSDFETWSAESEIRPSNVLAQEKLHVSLCQLENGNIWLLFDNFDDWKWANCYYSVSTDNGITWDDAVALTAYDSPQAKGLHPILIQKTLTQVYAVYHEEVGALHIDQNDAGWPGGLSSITGIHVYDGKVYAVATWPGSGNKIFYCVVEIDIATWRILRSWNTVSIPNFHTCFGVEHVWAMKNISNGKYVVIGTKYLPVIGVLNVETNTITHYYFFDWAKYAIVKNVNWVQDKDPENPTLDNTWNLSSTFVDETTSRLYIILKYPYAYRRIVNIVYIDLTKPLVPGSTYEVIECYYSENFFTETEIMGFDDGDFKVYQNDGIALLSSAQIAVPSWTGRLVVFLLNDVWAIYRDYEGGLGNPLPFHGLKKCVYLEGSVYGSFPYDAINYPERKGLCKIILASNSFYYLQPVWPVQYDDYQLLDIAISDDNKLIITSYLYGITIYDPAESAWSLYDNENVLGMTPDGEDNFGPVCYDPDSGLVIGGVPYLAGKEWYGVVAFNRYGMLKKPKYKIGDYTDDWYFGTENDFVTGYLDFDACVTLDPDDNGIYAFWVKQNLTLNEMSIKWAKETPEFDLTSYVIRDIPVIIKRTIQTDIPNTLGFSISHGHLFDPFNDISLWRNYVAKGHKLSVRMGEKISDIDYWQDVGTFLITERSMITYEKGKYPIMDIMAEDKRNNWIDSEIEVTDYYNHSPEFILAHILENDIGESTLDIDIPEFDNSITIYHQWVEVKAIDILKQICDRFGYFGKITVDDKFTCKKVSDQNDTDHVYPNMNTIITYTPDDTFSDYTTKIIVKCEGREFEEVIFPRERVLFLTGSIGWWGQKKERTEYYSENREKQVRNPELKKIESTEGIMFQLAGKVHESISEVDPEDKYVVVKIEAPDLRPALAAAIAAYVTGAGFGGTFWGEAGKTAALILALNILASISNYQFEIWGDPVGHLRRSWQAEAEDTDFKNLIGRENKKIIEEPLGYYINDAQAVADHEIMVLKLQRRRIKISKIAHLQDEEGDTIQVKHPYTGRDKKIFITDLTRQLKVSESPMGDGYFIDEIEGWFL